MGREQAMLTGRWLKETGIKFDKITFRYTPFTSLH
jgi:phosphohistidine phosphatase SixA